MTSSIKIPLRIFVISLAESTERREPIVKMFQAFNLKFEFVDGITANYVEKNIKKVYHKNLANRLYARDLSHSEIACSLSHQKVYHIMIKDNLPAALIFEDDTILKDEFIVSLEFINKKLNEGVIKKGVKLGASLVASVGLSKGVINFPSEALSTDFYLLNVDTWGAFSYVMTLANAKNICKTNYPVHLVSDECLRSLLVISPTAVKHNFDIKSYLRPKTFSDSSVTYNRFFYSIYYRKAILKKIYLKLRHYLFRLFLKIKHPVSQ